MRRRFHDGSDAFSKVQSTLKTTQDELPLGVSGTDIPQHASNNPEPTAPAKESWIADGLLVLFDQGIVSVANFLTTVIIGRACGETELGLYGLGFSIVILLAGLPKALIWTPYTTYYPRIRDEEERDRYTGSVTVHMYATIALAFASLLLIGGVAFLFNQTQYSQLLFVLAPFVALMILREHVRRLCLAWMKTWDVLLLDVCVSSVQIIGLLALWKAELISGKTAYIAAAAACSLGLVWLYLRRGVIRFDKNAIYSDLRTNWAFSKWVFGGALAVLAAHALYRGQLTYFHGLGAMGILTAAQSVITFINPVLLGVGNYYAPASATTFAKYGEAELWKSVARSTLALGGVILVFLIGISIVGAFAVELLYKGDAYVGQQHVITAVAIGILSEALLVPVECGLLAMGLGRILFLTALLRLFVAMTLGTYCIWQFEAAGLGYSLVVANGLTLMVQWSILRGRSIT